MKNVTLLIFMVAMMTLTKANAAFSQSAQVSALELEYTGKIEASEIITKKKDLTVSDILNAKEVELKSGQIIHPSEIKGIFTKGEKKETKKVSPLARIPHEY